MPAFRAFRASQMPPAVVVAPNQYPWACIAPHFSQEHRLHAIPSPSSDFLGNRLFIGARLQAIATLRLQK